MPSRMHPQLQAGHGQVSGNKHDRGEAQAPHRAPMHRTQSPPYVALLCARLHRVAPAVGAEEVVGVHRAPLYLLARLWVLHKGATGFAHPLATGWCTACSENENQPRQKVRQAWASLLGMYDTP